MSTFGSLLELMLLRGRSGRPRMEIRGFGRDTCDAAALVWPENFHVIFTGNPGVGKTTISRLVAKLYKQLGVSSKDHVVEVQKGDLVAGYVNQTAAKTAKKIAEAKGGILFVDEAYQLTEALMRGQSDFSGESIDEMMKCMLTTGRKSVTFIFAGYKKQMDEFITYNAGLESRIK